MPPIITSLVAKNICEDPKEDHWEARRFAAQLIARICRAYGDNYHTLQPRVTKTLLRAFLDPLKPLSTHYGAIVGLKALGPSVTKALILPNIKEYSKLLQPILQEKVESLRKHEARMCLDALKQVSKDYLDDEVKKLRTMDRNDQMEVDNQKVDIKSIEYGQLLQELFGL
jgi:transcription initiation factor TFIID subunit 6